MTTRPSDRAYPRPTSRIQFRIAIVCALHHESSAVLAMFDQLWEPVYEKSFIDTNSYTAGRIGQHNVVVVHLSDMDGLAAASSITNLRHSYPYVNLVLGVGICGGGPNGERGREMNLGDIVISNSMVQYTSGKRYADGPRRRKVVSADTLFSAPDEIRAFLHKVGTIPGRKRLLQRCEAFLDSMLQGENFADFRRPAPDTNRLFNASYRHKHQQPGVCKVCDRCLGASDTVCEEALTATCFQLGCEDQHSVLRKATSPAIHFGTVAAVNEAPESAVSAEKIVEENGAIAFEMEGAGACITVPTIIIKSVCNYSDGHKNKDWHSYSAAVAACCMKALLEAWAPSTPVMQASITTLPNDSVRNGVLAWIPAAKFNEEHDRRRKECFAGTGLWLEKQEKYQKWVSSEESGILWVTGTPGCGKSILSALIWDRLQRQRSASTGLGHFYCKRDDAALNTPWAVWTSILKEVSMQMGEVDDELKELYVRKAGLETAGPAVVEILSLLPRILQSFSKVFLLIDGLDECNGHGTFLTDLTALLKEGHHTTKVIIFSRPDYASICSTLKDVPKIRADRGANAEDIQTYINSIFREDEYSFNDEPKLLKQVTSTILSRAEGSFLYVGLLAKSLVGALGKDEIEERLNSLPENLNESYKEAMLRVLANQDCNQRERALLLLTWIANSFRPLTREELLEVLAVKPSMTSHKQLKKLPSDRHLVQLCADLIEVDAHGVYRLIHKSVKEYLESLEKHCPPDLEVVRLKQKQAHDILCTACLTYLSFGEFERDPVESIAKLKSFQDRYVFFSYAAQYWGQHCRISSDIDPLNVFRRLLDREKLRNLLAQFSVHGVFCLNSFNVPSGGTIPTPLHILAMYGLEHLVEERSTFRQDICKTDAFGFTPLEYAMLCCRHGMTRWLLERLDGKNLISARRLGLAPFHYAIENGWNDVVDLLIRKGFDSNRTSAGAKRLYSAVTHGNLEIVNPLFQEKKVDADTQDGNGLSAVTCAVRRSRVELFKSLFARNANPELRGNESRATTPHHALLADHDNVDHLDTFVGELPDEIFGRDSDEPRVERRTERFDSFTIFL